MEINSDFFTKLIYDISNVRFTRKLLKAYDVNDVDQFLDDVSQIIMSNNEDDTYKLKKLEYMINEKKFNTSFTGYNIKEVDDFLEDLIKRIQV